MTIRETLNQHSSDRLNPNILAPGDDETLEPGEFTTEEDVKEDPDQADQIPKVGAAAKEGAEDDDTAEDDESDDEDDDSDDDAVEDGEVEEGSGGHV